MSDLTVRQLAEVVGIPLERLLSQLSEAGLEKSGAEELLTDKEKLKFLTFLRQSHGKEQGGEDVTNPKRVTLQRRTVSELKQGKATPGKVAKTISVEVRKKRTYVKRSELPEVSERLHEAEAARLALEEQQRRAADAEAQRLREERERHETEERKRREREARESMAAEQETVRQREAQRRLEAERLADQKPEVLSRPEEPAPKPTATPAPRVQPEAPKPRPSTAPPAAARAAEMEEERRGKKKERDKLLEDGASLDSLRIKAKVKKKVKPGKPVVIPESRHGFEKPTGPVVREVSIPESITVSDLAQRMSVKATEVIKALMKMGVMATINQILDQDTAILVVEEMGHTAVRQVENVLEAEIEATLNLASQAEQTPRAPVVTIMSRRSRQNLAAGLHSQESGRGGRGGRHHAAHRRLSGQDRAGRGYLPGYARPRRVHRHARAWRPGHGHRGAGRGGGRWRDAADARGDRTLAGRQGPDGGGGQQNRQARGRSRKGQA